MKIYGNKGASCLTPQEGLKIPLCSIYGNRESWGSDTFRNPINQLIAESRSLKRF